MSEIIEHLFIKRAEEISFSVESAEDIFLLEITNVGMIVIRTIGARNKSNKCVAPQSPALQFK